MVPGERSDARVARLEGLYREALALTEAARFYLERQAPEDRRGASQLLQATIACESMRVSARLTQVLSWLMTRRAVLAGELSPEEARRPRQRLTMRAICAAESPVTSEPLPPRLAELLARSRALYLRVARLDALLDRAPTMPSLHGSLVGHAKAAGRRRRQVD